MMDSGWREPLRVRLQAGDLRVLHFVVGRRHVVLDEVLGRITHLGSAVFTIGVVVWLFGAGGQWEAAAWTSGFALAVSHALVQLLKRTVVRPRPRLPVGVHCLAQAPDRFSFPSGHAAAALSVALGVAPSLDPTLAAAAISGALLVGFSRCYLGVHYPGDVAAGWFLAVVGMALSPG